MPGFMAHMAPKEEPIGHLTANKGEFGYRVVGACCKEKRGRSVGSKIYRVNIFPYKQTCCECGDVLVQPAAPVWPELFNGK